jgi:AcrR family transcriptional regulator
VPKEKKSKKRILDTATILFGKHGKNGISTARIAKEAKVNKALIFYYFGSKDGLYRSVLKLLIQNFIKSINKKISNVESGLPIIELFVREHIASLNKNQILVKFMLRELSKAESGISPELHDCMTALHIIRDNLLKAIADAQKKNEIRTIDPLYTIVNIISLDIFFYLGKPIVGLLNPNIDSEVFEQKRVDHVIDLLMNGLKKHPE